MPLRKVALAVSLVISNAAFASEPSPCSTEGELSAPNSGGTYVRRSFRDGQYEYPIDVFSLGDKDPATWGAYCLRYEVVNASGKPIPIFYWNLLSSSQAYDLDPDERRKRVHQRPSRYPDLTISKTTLKAFRTAEVDANVKRTVEEAATAANDVDLSSWPYFTNVASRFPNLTPQLVSAGLPVGKLLTYAAGSGTPSTLPPLADTLETKFGKITSRSTARLGAKGWEIDVKFSVAPTRNITPALYAPATIAAAKAGDATIFLKYLPEFQKVSLPLERQGVFFLASYKTIVPRGDQPVFVVEQPVTVVWGDMSDCLQIASFSPYPISVKENYCR